MVSSHTKIPATPKCGFGAATPSRRGGTLRFLGPGDPDHLDPVSEYYVRAGQVLRALTRQLYAYPASGDLSDPRAAFTPAPDVAAEIPTAANGGISPDRTVYTIRLRDGVMWDSAPPRPVTAADFVRGLKRLPNPVAGSGALHYFTSTILGMRQYAEAYRDAFRGAAPAAGDLARFQEAHEIAGARALDDRTLELRLRRPANDFLNILAMGFASAAPAEYDAYLPDSEEFRRNTRSDGPYRIARYEAGGREIVLERNPAWSQDADPIRHQYVDAIRLVGAGEPYEKVRRRIDAGEIDLAWPFAVVSWGKAGPDREMSRRSHPGFTLNPYLVFNLLSPNAGGAMRDVRVRQAIAYAVDKAAISRIFEVLEGVTCAPLHSVIPPGSVGHREFDPYPTPGDGGDPDRARRLLEDAGYGGGLRLVAAVRDAKLHLDVVRSVARDLQRVGIDLELRTYSQADYYGALLPDPDRARAGDWDIAEPGWTPDWFGNNGRAVVQPLFQSNPGPGTANYGGYSEPEVDALIAAALEEPDPARADELWHRVDARVMRDLPVLPLLAFAAMTSRYHSRRVKNAIHVPQIEFFDITHLWLDPPD